MLPALAAGHLSPAVAGRLGWAVVIAVVAVAVVLLLKLLRIIR